MANVDTESSLDPSDLYVRHRIERQRLLEQRVAETLALKLAKPCPLLKGSEHGTYKLSLDEEQRELRDYHRKSRQVRIMQVRAQEMLLAAQKVGEFRQRKKKEKQKLLQILKEAWQEQQRRRITEIEEGFMNSCKGIGQSHDAAEQVVRNMAAIAEEKAKQAEESRLWENLRYQKAKQEAARRSESNVDQGMTAKDRRRVVEFAADIERTRARNCASRAKSKAVEQEKLDALEEFAEGSESYLHPDFDSHDIRRKFIQSRLAGTPNDYKNTYFHSRFCVLKDRTNLNCSNEATHHLQHQAEISDAWEAAEAHLKSVELAKERKSELEEIWNKNKVERGQAAIAHLQKTALLEKALVLQLEKEKERKHQLGLIEELSLKTLGASYTADERIPPRPKISANKEIDLADAFKNEESLEHNMRPEIGIVSPVKGGHFNNGSSKPIQLVEEETRAVDAVVLQLGMPLPDSGVCIASAQEVIREDGHINTKEDEVVVDGKDPEVVVVRVSSPRMSATPRKTLPLRRPATPRKIPSVELEMPVNCTSSITVNGDRIQAKNKMYQEAGEAPTNLGSKLSACTLKVKSKPGSIRMPKAVLSASQIPSLSKLITNSNIRKGNKSPQRFDSPGRPSSNGLENEARSVEFIQMKNKLRNRRSVQSAGGLPEKRTPLPTISLKADCCSTERKIITPRRQNGTWLSNVLERLTWWKSDKEFSVSGVSTAQDKAELNRSCLGDQLVRASSREIRKESTPKFSVKQADGTSKSHNSYTSIPLKDKGCDNVNIPTQGGWQSDVEPGWYEAYTKDVFSSEELEALQLELYGTWSDGTVPIYHNKMKPKKDMPKDQNEGESLSKSKNSPCRSHIQGTIPDYITSKDISNDLVGQFSCEEVEGPSVQENQLLNSMVKRNAVMECLLPLDGKSSRDLNNKLSLEDVKPRLENESYQSKPLSTHHERATVSSSECRTGIGSNAEVEGAKSTNGSTKKEPGESPSARDVAEKLIQAWRTGQLGMNLKAIDPVKQKGIQKSRKKRARADEELQLHSSSLGIVNKCGFLRENINSSKLTAATKFRKEEVSASLSQSAARHENEVAKTNSLSQDQEDTRTRRISSKRFLSPNYLQYLPADCNIESRKGIFHIDRNLREEEDPPEARSLDFILGSLSAQVKELDERLQNVTSYATGTINYSAAVESTQQKLSPNTIETISTLLAGNPAQFRDQSKLDSKCPGAGGREDCKLPEFCKMEEQTSPKVAVTLGKSPRVDRQDVSETDAGDAVRFTQGGLTGTTCFGEARIHANQEGHSSSMGICLENLATLVQEMNGPTSKEIGIQLPQKFGCTSNCTGTGISSKLPSCDTKSNCAKVFKRGFLSHGSTTKSSKEDFGSRLYFTSFAELCSLRAEPAIVDAEGLRPGMENQNVDGPRHSLEPQRLSLSSIDLKEAMSLDEIEEQLLLSGSVDFSPWSTDKLPDVFPGIADAGRSLDQVTECDPTHLHAADDGYEELKPVFCHVKRESEWLFRVNKFKRKSKAYEKSRAGKVKGKQRSSRKPFNPIALPPRRSTPRTQSFSPRRPSSAIVSPKVDISSNQPSSPLPGALKFQKKELKGAKDGSAKLNLTTRSLPAQFPASVAAEEVRKWLCREAVGCPMSLPEETVSRESLAVLRHQARFPGYKRPELLEIAGHRGKLLAQAAVKIPDWGIKEVTCPKKATQHILESRRRPVSAGTVLKCS